MIWVRLEPAGNVLHRPTCGYVLDADPDGDRHEFGRVQARAWLRAERDRRLCLRCRPSDPRLTLAR